MTTIAAVRDGKRTWIGSDTQAQSDGRLLSVERKWFRFDSWAAGVAGDGRAGCICEAHAKRLFDDLAGAFDFTERFYKLLKEYDFDLSAKRDYTTPNTGQDLVLASPSGLWLIPQCLSIVPVERWAEGSGSGFGLGAMHAMREIDDAERVLHAAPEAAMACDVYTGGEIWTDVLEA